MNLKIVLIIFHGVIIAFAGYIRDKLDGKAIKIDRLDGQCNGKNLPFQTVFQGVKSNGKKVSVSTINMIIKEDLLDKMNGVITITRCHSKENLNSCAEFYKIENFDICRAMNPDGLIGQNPFAAPFEPKLKCPFKMGNYTASNYSVDLTPFLFFNPDGWYWKIKSEISFVKPPRLVGCLYMDACTVSKSHA